MPSHLTENHPPANIKFYMKTYFHNQSDSALASILAWRALAFRANRQMSGSYNEVMPMPQEKIIFQNVSISHLEIGQFFQIIIGQATTLFIEQLMIKQSWWEEI